MRCPTPCHIVSLSFCYPQNRARRNSVWQANSGNWQTNGLGPGGETQECTYHKTCTSSVVPTAPSGYTLACPGGDESCGPDEDISYDRHGNVGGGLGGVLYESNCTNTVELCASACEALGGCCGFSFVFNEGQYESQNLGRCVAKACGGVIVTFQYGTALYSREAGAVMAPPSPPKAPPSPQLPPHLPQLAPLDTLQTSSTSAVLFVVPTSVNSEDDLTASQKATIQQAIASAAGVDDSHVQLNFVLGSIVIMAIVYVPSDTTAASIASGLSTILGTKAAASFALDVTVSTDPTIETTTPYVAQNMVSTAAITGWSNAFNDAYAKAAGLAIGVLVGIIAGVVFGVTLFVVLMCWCCQCCCFAKNKTTAVTRGGNGAV